MGTTPETIIGTPTLDPTLPRRFSDFDTLVEALDYAAEGVRGVNFFTPRGELNVSLTYRELREQAVEFARRLTAFGLKKGDRVALIAETTADFVTKFLGCQYASVLPVPLPLPTSFGGRDGYVSQLRGQMKSCGAIMLLGPDAMDELMTSASDGLGLRFVGSRAGFEDAVLADGPLKLPTKDDLAYLQYSSGSTRFPHGVAVTHRSVMANCHGQGYYGVQLQDDDRCNSWLPFYHDMGLVGQLLTPVTCQVSVDYLATEDFARRPMMWLTLMSRNRGTVSYSPTFGYDICARRVGPTVMETLDLSHWRVAGIGGDMIRPDVMRRFAKTFEAAGFNERAFVPSYGLAECTLAVSFVPVGRGIEVDMVEESILSGEAKAGQLANGHVRHLLNGAANDHSGLNGKKNGVNGHHAVNGHRGINGINGVNGGGRLREVVNCGVPLPEYEVEIRSEDGAALSDRAIGRVFVRGPSVMREYFADEETTRRVLTEDGWLDTGDMGYMLNECLFIIGRAKDLIIVNGRNHWPQDIEWAAEQLPGIRSGDIAAISVPGDDMEEVPTVLVHCRVREPREREAFAEEVKAQIYNATGVACRIELIPPRTLPRTSSGKLSRSKARAQFLSGGITALAS